MHVLILQVDLSRLWLKVDIEDTGYFPVDSNGHFRLQDNARVLPYCTLLVKGPEQLILSAMRSATASSTSFNSPSSSHIQHIGPGFRSVVYSHNK